MIDLGRARTRLRGGAEREPRGAGVVRSLALAEELRVRLEREGVNRAALAREHGITRARVTQLLALLSLPPELLEWIRRCGADEWGLSERRLRPLLGAPRAVQMLALASLCSSFRASRRARA